MKTEDDIRREKLFKKLSKKAGKSLMEHRMLEEGDRLLAGLSGGKDSLIMLEILADRIKALPFHVDLAAVHVTVENIGYEINKDYLDKFCASLDIPIIHKTVAVDPDGSEKSPCFICSWQRRKTIFNLTKEGGFNKLAFGHHRDDALETFMMNLLYHGSVSSMPYDLSMFEGRIKLIRPLLDLWEKDLAEYAALRNFTREEKQCPFDRQTKRAYTRKVIEDLQETYPKAKINMFKALGNIYGEYLPARPNK